MNPNEVGKLSEKLAPMGTVWAPVDSDSDDEDQDFGVIDHGPIPINAAPVKEEEEET